jgi:lysylphosphatidylglycerol synthetase-like protein (DUF2156 family)
MAAAAQAPVLELTSSHAGAAAPAAVLHAEFGTNSLSPIGLSSLPIYESACGDFVIPGIKVGRTWVMSGEPVGPTSSRGIAAEEFAHLAGRAAFFGVDEAFAQEWTGWAMIIGAQPIWDLSLWSEKADQARSIRCQVRRAAAKAVTAIEVSSASTRKAAAEIREERKHSRLLDISGFAAAPLNHNARTFAAIQNGTTQAILTAAPLPARQGWAIHETLRHATAPNGTLELLISHAFHTFHQEGAKMATLGLCALSSRALPGKRAALTRKALNPIYSFDGIEAFRAKLRPDSWENLYLVGSSGLSRLEATASVGKALLNRPQNRA